MNHRDELEVFGVGDSSNVALDEHVDALMSVDTGLASADTTLQAAKDTSELDGYNQSLPQLSDLFPDEDSGVNDDPYLDDLIDLGLHSTAESVFPLFADQELDAANDLVNDINNSKEGNEMPVHMEPDQYRIENTDRPVEVDDNVYPSTLPIHCTSDNTSGEEEEPSENPQELSQELLNRTETQEDSLIHGATPLKRRRETSTADDPQRHEQKLLHHLVSKQQVYLDNFRAMLSLAPVNDVRMALMTPIESYIHLGKDFNQRREQILAMREEKLDTTRKYIEEKAKGLDVNQPHAYSDMFERFGKVYCVNFAISKYEDVTLAEVGRAIYDQVTGSDTTLSDAMGCLSVRESYDKINCRFMHQRIVTKLKVDHVITPDMESNAVLFATQGDDQMVLATDYIDHDELYPYKTKDHIRKDTSSGVVLTRQVDADGRESIIMKRFLMTKFHLHTHQLTDDQHQLLLSRMPIYAETMREQLTTRLRQENRDVSR